MRKLFIVVLTLVVLTGCNNTKKDNKESISNVDTCPNCVFGYSENTNEIGLTLSNYTRNYKTLKYDDGTQRKEFLGYVIDSENKILKGYVCGIVNDKVLCLESDSSKYEYNKELLNNNFSLSVCKDDTSDNYGPYYECDSDDIYMAISPKGYVYITSEEECDINNGIMACVK